MAEQGRADNEFRGYSDEQLDSLRRQIDPAASPGIHAQILSELQRRQNEAVAVGDAEITEPQQWCNGRFTIHDGMLGSFEAAHNRSPFFSEGRVSIGAERLIVQGWRRTWLGVAYRDEEILGRERIRNVTCQDRVVEFEYSRRSYWPRSRLRFIADSEADAQKLFADLPRTNSAEFSARLLEAREFKGRLTSVTGWVWATPLLVLANICVFVAMAIAAHRVQGFDISSVVSWGANLGTLTVNGQWWRLVAALFIHLSLLHLVLNLWVLWNAGRLTERLYGSGLFLSIYLGSGVLGGLASIAWQPANASAGASGAIFGILGAQLAFLVHRDSGVPRQVFRTHWFSTLAFVVYNLARSALTPGIDNAAHVGGLLGGIILGWILVRPLETVEREEFPFHKAVAAGFVFTAAVLFALTQVTGFGSQLSGPEQYGRAHMQFSTGEAENLAAWQEIAARAASGASSDAEVRAEFAKRIVPFWEREDRSLRSELPALPQSQKAFAKALADYTQLRLQLAQAIANSTDQGSGPEIAQLVKDTMAATARVQRLALRASMDHRPRALAQSSFVTRARAWFGARRHCVQYPVAYGPLVGASDAPADGPAMRHAIACRAQDLFLSEDFVTLDRALNSAAKSLKDLPDGSSSLQALVSGLNALAQFGNLQVADAFGRTASWRDAVPGSLNADLIEAQIFMDWAWTARGSGAANEVSPQAMALFAQRTAMAEAGLQEADRRHVDSPIWYQLEIDAALDQSQDSNTIRAIFDRGIENFPDYLPLYRGMVRALMPRWGGSYEKVDQFIAGMSLPSQDWERYARLYWIYDTLENDDVNIFTDGLARWLTMKKGFLAMMRHYPNSDFISNGFARFACISNDSSQYMLLRPNLKQHYSATAWSRSVSVESCDKKFNVDANNLKPQGAS